MESEALLQMGMSEPVREFLRWYAGYQALDGQIPCCIDARGADWTPEHLRRRAGEIGPNTSALVEIVLRERRHPEQGFRSSIGIIRLVNAHGRDRLEAACGWALAIGARSYTSVISILKNNLDRKRPESAGDGPATDGPAISHSNVRGPGYFH